MKTKTTVERYSAAIEASMKIIQFMEEIDRCMGVIHENLTCHELVGQKYDSQSVQSAFYSASVGVVSADYVKSQCVYMDVDVSLHEPPESLGREAMKKLIEASGAKKHLIKQL